MRRLRELDGLRGLAALGVVVAHFNYDGLTHNAGAVKAFVDVARLYSLANLAVVFFFVLSSFLLTTLALRELDATCTFSRQRFMVRRIARIWPLYWLAVLASVWLTQAQPEGFSTNSASWPWLRDHLWLYAAFLGNWSFALSSPDWHTDRSLPGLSVLWSIAVEEQFYILFALAAGTALRSGRRMALAVVLALVAGTLYRWWHLTMLSPVQTVAGIYYATPTYLETFAAGALMAWLLHRDGGRLQRLLRHPLSAVIVLGLFWAIARYNLRIWSTPGGPLVVQPIDAVVMALVVGWATSNGDRRLVRWTLGSWPLRTIGLLSYGLYVWHPVAWGLGTWWQLPDGSATFPVYLLLTLVMAIVTYWLVERPCIMLGRKWRTGWDSNPRGL